MEFDIITGGSLLAGSVGTSLGIMKFILTSLQNRVKALENKDVKHEEIIMSLERQILELRLLNEKNHALLIQELHDQTKSIKEVASVIKDWKDKEVDFYHLNPQLKRPSKP